LLSVTNLSKDGSIIKLWSNDPVYSNADGSINFEGVIFNPGFSGTEGKVLTVTFMPKKTAKANIFFNSGSILANDGKATNILGQLGTASFTIGNNLQVSGGNTTTPVENPLLPLAPKIVSATNPDSNKWYKNNQPSFSWEIPDGVTAVRTAYDRNPSTIPSKLYEPAISTKTLDNVADGVYYFHAQFKNAYGWGAIAHFRFQVDTTPPAPFVVSFPQGSESNNPKPAMTFNSTDKTSGIDHYELKIGDNAFTPFDLMPILSPGKYNVIVKAIDKAGNSTLQSADFIVDALSSPTITNYPSETTEGEMIKISGTTYPNSTLTILLKNKDGRIYSESGQSDSTGGFNLILSQTLPADVYQMTAQVTDSLGAQSLVTLPININVKQKEFLRIGSLVLNYLSVIIMLILAIASVLAFIFLTVHHLVLFRRKLRRDLKNLKEDFKEEIELLETAKLGRKLTKEESLILKKLSGKKLTDLEKDVK
jgi:hypothetical protein